MNLSCNFFTIEGNGIVEENGDMNLLSIGEHEVEGLELGDFVGGVDEWVAEHNKRIEGQEVAFDLVVVLGVDGLVGEELELVSETLRGDVGADVVCFE